MWCDAYMRFIPFAQRISQHDKFSPFRLAKGIQIKKKIFFLTSGYRASYNRNKLCAKFKKQADQ